MGLLKDIVCRLAMVSWPELWQHPTLNPGSLGLGCWLEEGVVVVKFPRPDTFVGAIVAIVDNTVW